MKTHTHTHALTTQHIHPLPLLRCATRKHTLWLTFSRDCASLAFAPNKAHNKPIKYTYTKRAQVHTVHSTIATYDAYIYTTIHRKFVHRCAIRNITTTKNTHTFLVCLAIKRTAPDDDSSQWIHLQITAWDTVPYAYIRQTIISLYRAENKQKLVNHPSPISIALSKVVPSQTCYYLGP